MNKEDQKDGVMNQMYLGHRVHLNWPLIIIMAWMSMVIFGALNKPDEEGHCLPQFEIFGDR